MPAPAIPDLIVLLALSELLRGLRQAGRGLDRGQQGVVRGWLASWPGCSLWRNVRAEKPLAGPSHPGNLEGSSHFSDMSRLREPLMSFLFRLFIYLTIYLFGLHLEVVQGGKGEMCGCGLPLGAGGLKRLKTSQSSFGGFLPLGRELPLSVVKEKPGSEVPEPGR